MKYLSRGQEPKNKVAVLLSLTKIGENMQAGVYDHLCNNFTVTQSAVLNGLKSQNLSTAISDLNAVAAKVEKLYELKVHG